MNARLELGTDVTFESGADLLNPLTYAEFVTTITIYPTDYDAKLYVVEKLKAYNTDKAEADQIVYTDVGQTATDIVGQIVQVISAVLIAFASISLVVSSVMIGIIIYSSVVERTKEIGILRSIGARKKDVGRLFKAEAVIIGFMSGVIGVVMTYIISVPISLTMDHQFPQNQLGMIALLNPLHAVLLILISMILTYIASLIPSRIAAKKDPVTCLRTE
jgi:putative ABC transport system permease protein